MTWCPVLKPLLTPHHLTIGTMDSDFRWELNLPASSTPVPRAEAHKHMFSRFPKAAGYWGVLHFASLQEEILMACTTSCLGSYSIDSTGWPQISPSPLFLPPSPLSLFFCHFPLTLIASEPQQMVLPPLACYPLGDSPPLPCTLLAPSSALKDHFWCPSPTEAFTFC